MTEAFAPSTESLDRRGISRQDITASDVQRSKDGSPYYTLSCDGRWEYLTKHLGHIAGTGSAHVELFWLEDVRKQSFDLLWGNYPGAIRFTVDSGPYKGWVGYFRGIR